MIIQSKAGPIWASAIVGWVLCSSLSAVEVLSNLTEPGDIQIPLTAGQVGVSFTTAADPYILDAIVVNLVGSTPHDTAGGDADLRIRVGAPPTITSLVEDLGIRTVFSDSGPVTFPSVGSILSPHTTYWLIVSMTGGSEVRWGTAINANETSSIGWQIGDSRVTSTDGGVTFSTVAGPPIPQFAILAHPVPEPSTLATASLTLAIVTVLHQSMRCRNSRRR